MKATKETIASFGKFYPKTLEAMGGSKGLEKWLAGDDIMPAPAAHVFHAENSKVIDDAREFEELSGTELVSVICELA